MTAARAKQVFLEAAVLPAADRPAFIDRACDGDADLRGRVMQLLAAHDGLPTGEGEEGPLPTTADVPKPPADEIGQVIAGRYKLLEAIGEGGMGSVWMAQQVEPVKRNVAVKLIKAGMDTRSVLARFEAERQALAIMDHPNIAKALDAGATADGRPYFVMELVKGTPITKFCDGRRLPPRDRLELFVPICNAVQHAHTKGIIHRDIKPSNILVALYDDKPVPKVIDFGVAKAAGQPLTELTLATGYGAIVGTPEYMSPEQASFNQLDVDTRSDIYALGVVLYELLTGSTPVDRRTLGEAALLEVLRVVREVDPPRPSTRLTATASPANIAAMRGTDPSKLARLLRGELDWVVMKALEKDRSRRYESAANFAADVQRYLSGEAVHAVPPSAAYRLRKFARKHKGQVVAGGAVAVTIVGGLVGTSWQAIRAEREADRARYEEGRTKDALVQAEKNQKLAERNQEQAEKNLVRSFLRPVGYNPAGFDPAELYALSELSDLDVQPSRLSGDIFGDMVTRAEHTDVRMKILCLKEALSEGETALRTARRSERFIQAAVGASPERRKAALEVVGTVQRDEALDIRIRLAACWFAIELGSSDLPAFAASCEWMKGQTYEYSDGLFEALGRSAGRLNAEQVRAAAQLVIRHERNEIGDYATPSLAARILKSLSPDEARRYAEEAVRVLVTAENTALVRSAASMLATLFPLLHREQARRLATLALDAMVAVKGTVRARAQVMEFVPPIAPYCDAPSSARGAECVVQLFQPDNQQPVPKLGDVLTALIPNVDAGAASGIATASLDALARGIRGPDAHVPELIEKMAPAATNQLVGRIADAMSASNEKDFWGLVGAFRRSALFLDPPRAKHYAEKFTAALADGKNTHKYWASIYGLAALASRLDSPTAAKVFEAVRPQLEKTTELGTLVQLTNLSAELIGRMDATARKGALASSGAVLAGAIDKLKSSDHIFELDDEVAALAPDLGRAVRAGVVDAVLGRVVSERSANQTITRTDWLASWAETSDDKRVVNQKSTDRLIDALRKDGGDDNTKYQVIEAIRALVPRLSLESQARTVAAVSEIVLPRIAASTSIQTPLATYLTEAVALFAPYMDRSAASRALASVLSWAEISLFADGRVTSCFVALAPRLGAADAAGAVAVLLDRARKATDSYSPAILLAGIKAFAANMDAAGRLKFDDAAVALVKAATELDQLQFVAECASILAPTQYRLIASKSARTGIQLSCELSAKGETFNGEHLTYFLARVSDWRHLAELLAHPGCADFVRESVLRRLEELLIGPMPTGKYPGLEPAFGLALEVAAWERNRKLRTVWGAVEFIQKNHPEFPIGQRAPRMKLK